MNMIDKYDREIVEYRDEYDRDIDEYDRWLWQMNITDEYKDRWIW